MISARSGTTLRLDAAWCDGHQHQKTGIVLGKFISQRMAQLNLFDEDALRPNSETLMLLINELNQQDRIILYFAEQGIKQSWQMKREMLSPYYTARLTDVPSVRA
ncbi:DUF4113 domain-containing protein [Cronobacter sakazakii]|uniref:DUF4113 domain-containing protein n=1 Tax=Cronobacter sakazakii TaxID=28141 RepID=UPI0030EB2D67